MFHGGGFMIIESQDVIVHRRKCAPPRLRSTHIQILLLEGITVVASIGGQDMTAVAVDLQAITLQSTMERNAIHIETTPLALLRVNWSIQGALF